ncbi:response regulator [Spirulina sp. 06S082]|uniref:response regulator n=1 Tax=Spirulina sp. 06S082 TaxID=3110248 RepID=UPI002B1F68A1|nr:response regulator [Spirulina sp. 06S082]MEA5470117.1 response regulator [Spirulina sp. 06S082]
MTAVQPTNALNRRSPQKNAIASPMSSPSTSSYPFDAQAIKAQLTSYSEQKFTGKLELQLTPREKWDLYLNLGRLIWATGGLHPVRRWRRQLWRCCREISPNQINLRNTDALECWDYQILVIVVQRKLSETEPIVATMLGMMTEVLFDIVQLMELVTLKLKATQNPAQSKHQYSLIVHPGVRPSDRGLLPQNDWLLASAIMQIDLIWQQWVNAGLKGYSPNFAPMISNPQKLQKIIPETTYKNLVTLCNGQRTLRDIAALCQQDVLKLSTSLAPYIRQKAIKLIQLPDLPHPDFREVKKSGKPRQPLIACIEDNEQTLQILKEILTEAGYRFLAIAREVETLPMLLQHEPDLIFLDLVMPIANGYEICAQIRRIERFKEIPIVILTGKDGLGDRVRAKMVGATNFLTKPIDADKVLNLIGEHLNNEQ